MRQIIFLIGVFAAVCLSISGQSVDPTAEDYFNKGLTLLRQKQYEAALVAFKQSERIDPKQPAISANIGAAYIALKRPGDAVAAFQKAIDLRPNEATFHTAICRAYALTKEFDKAIAECREGIRLAPDQSDAYESLIQAIMMARRPGREFQQNIEEAIARFRNNEVLLVLAAGYYLQARDYSSATATLKSLLVINDKVARYHGMLSEVYLRSGSDTESLDEARTALRLEPTNPYANYAMGLIFFELGQNDEAVEAFSKVNVDDTRLIYGRYFLALSEARRGRRSAAVDVLRPLLDSFPDNIELEYELAENLSDLYRYDEAESIYLRLNTQLSGRNDGVLTGLGMIYMMRGQFEKAIPQFEEALRLRPDNEFYKMFLNVARGRQNVIPQIPAMIREVENKPSEVKRRIDIARSLAFANRFDEAEKYIKEIYALDPADSDIYQILGVSFSEMGRKDKALEAYSKALEKRENPGAYLGMAAIYSERGEFEKASAAYAKVIQLKTDTPNVMKSYADLLRDNGKRREALDMYKRSLAIQPLNAQALFEAAILSFKLGDPIGGKQYLSNLRGVDAGLAAQIDRCLRLRIWG